MPADPASKACPAESATVVVTFSVLIVLTVGFTVQVSSAPAATFVVVGLRVMLTVGSGMRAVTLPFADFVITRLTSGPVTAL